jgi:hypothetical protein
MAAGQRLTRFLGRSQLALGAWAVVAAFSTYYCMYAFRKPFTAASYEEFAPVLGVDFKTVLTVTQVIGYASSKFLGIKIVSEMAPAKRAFALLGMIGVAEVALLLFAVVPAPYNAFFLFLNGLPLGMVWGLTFGFLEGRRMSEILGVGLSGSYIVASGHTKYVGVQLLEAGVPTQWMPFATGLVFVVPLVLAVAMLAVLPQPDERDVAERTVRVPMDAAARRSFFLAFLPGLLPLTLLHFVLTAYRDFRDNFVVELWKGLGYAGAPEKLATTEQWITVGVLGALALLMVIKSHRTALVVVHAVMATGTALVGVSTLAFRAGLLAPDHWMLATGFGLYLAYVPYGCILFERMVAALGIAATTGFLIYVVDAVGYLGSVVLQLFRSFGAADLSWVDFFVGFSYVTSVVCTVAFLASMVYFARVTAVHEAARRAQAA